MINSQTTQAIFTRDITQKEIKKARSIYYMAIPLFLIVGFVLWIVLKVDVIPEPAKYATIGIAIMALLISIYKFSQIEKEIKQNKIEVITGIVTNKYKIGPKKKPVNNSNHTSRSSSYIIVINDKNYWVNRKYFNRAQKGKQMQLVRLPKSQITVALNSID